MKQIWKWLIVGPIIVGIVVAIMITVKKQTNKINEQNKIQNIFGNLASAPVQTTKFYTYGTSLNVEGRIKGISKDNFEGVKLVLKDGEAFEKLYDLSYSFDNNDVIVYTDTINKAIYLDELPAGKKYYVQIRLKVNNSKDYKYYTLSNVSEYKDIEYYTLTKDGKNNKIDIKFENFSFDGKKYDYLGLNVVEASLPENVYDFVVDSGHGGTDKGNTYGEYNERDMMLDYGKALKASLEEKGYKVKLSRDDSNTSTMTELKVYDDDGRITICCESKAKYMISLHNTDNGYSGFEVYVPNNSDFGLATTIANNLNATGLEYSKNTAYKKQDGIYQKNYNSNSIKTYTDNLIAQGIEPYNLTDNTPTIYTIREVGGIATNAYADGRNTKYSKNKYYDSNQGIESYQICVGNIKSNLEILLNEKDSIISAISSAF